jgi:ParB family chromosome partitioning protein
VSPTAATNGNGNGHSPASTIKQIALSEISVSMLEPQVRRREHFKPAELQELADSILSMGLISPITVRPKTLSDQRRTEQQYELVAGERRYLATKLAGLDTIEAVVRDLDDQQTIEIQLHENLKRLEIEPLDEAFSYKYLIDHAQILEGGLPRPYTVADIAAKFSRTEKIILRRLKLHDLGDKGRKDLADGKLPLAHAELIACFPEKEQNEILQLHAYTWSGTANTLKDLRAGIARSVVRSLTKAPFDVADKSLHPKGLVCADCHQRTGYAPGLFEGDLEKNDACMNGKCYESKIASLLKAKRTEIANTRPNSKGKHDLARLEKAVPLIRNGWSTEVPLGKDATYVDDRSYDRKFEKAKKADECPDVETALYVEGDNVGKTQLICRNGSCKVHKKKTSSSSSGYQQTPKQKEDDLNEKVLDAVRKTIIFARVNTFDAKQTVWASSDLRRRLLLSILQDASGGLFDEKVPTGLDETFLPAKLKKLVNTYNAEEKDIAAAIAKLTPDEESRIFALIAFGSVGYFDYWDKKQSLEPIKELATEVGLNYQLLDAETRLELVPEKSKETIKEYIEAVKAGTAGEPPKIFDIPKPPKKAKPAKAKKGVKK